MGFFDRLDSADVVDAKTFAAYAQQVCGIPLVTGKDVGLLSKQIKAMMQQNPAITFQTLCKVADWARAKKKRPSRVQSLLAMLNWCWSDGFLPELDDAAGNHELEERIFDAAEQADSEWRRRLLAAEGDRARERVLELWQQHRMVVV